MRDEDPVLNRTSYSLLSFNAFTNLDTSREAKVWLGSPPNIRRTYTDGFICDPTGTCSDTYYNLWRGFNVESRPGDWSLMRQHIEFVCQDAPEYAIRWLAFLVQHPEMRAEVALVMRGANIPNLKMERHSRNRRSEGRRKLGYAPPSSAVRSGCHFSSRKRDRILLV